MSMFEQVNPQQQLNLQHAGFQTRHNKSDRALFVVAWWLHRQGKTLMIPGKRQAPTVDVNLNYVDQGDLFIIEPDGRSLLVEVHGYNIDFTDHWPFEDIILKSVESADRIGMNNIDRFIICNSALTHAAIVYGRDDVPRFRTWTRWITPSNTGNKEHKYVCSPDDAVFVRLKPDPA